MAVVSEEFDKLMNEWKTQQIVPGWKLFRLRKDNTLGSLFINRSRRIFTMEWIEAEPYPTKGYALRVGWHATSTPNAPHLSMKNRIWVPVDLSEVEKWVRPKSQGGTWLIARWMRVRPYSEWLPISHEK